MLNSAVCGSTGVRGPSCRSSAEAELSAACDSNPDLD